MVDTCFINARHAFITGKHGGQPYPQCSTCILPDREAWSTFVPLMLDMPPTGSGSMVDIRTNNARHASYLIRKHGSINAHSLNMHLYPGSGKHDRHPFKQCSTYIHTGKHGRNTRAHTGPINRLQCSSASLRRTSPETTNYQYGAVQSYWSTSQFSTVSLQYVLVPVQSYCTYQFVVVHVLSTVQSDCTYSGEYSRGTN
jgi:hypothetical protein